MGIDDVITIRVQKVKKLQRLNVFCDGPPIIVIRTGTCINPGLQGGAIQSKSNQLIFKSFINGTVGDPFIILIGLPIVVIIEAIEMLARDIKCKCNN